MSLREKLAIIVVFGIAGFAVGAHYLPHPRPLRGARVVQMRPTEDRATLRMLAVGISRYGDDRLSLRYARDDAMALAESFEAQAQGIYAAAATVVLVDQEATAGRIRAAFLDLIATARPQDVIAIFLAGHGILDRGGGYYFLTYDAQPAALAETALPIAEIERLIRLARQKVRTVIVLLDTCHAGAAWPGSDFRPAPEPGAGLHLSEGLFLLAASKPGETSQERSHLSHGVFTHALLRGIAGEADGDGDHSISISELFGYVAREVEQITGGAQHPYYRLEGTDFAVAALPAMSASADRRPGEADAAAPAGNRIAVLRFENLAGDSDHQWFAEALQMAFNTELSKVAALRVLAPELVDSTCRAYPGDLEALGRLGLDRLITGSFSVFDERVHIDARIVSLEAGVQEGSESLEGDLGDFFDLQKQLVLRLLRRLRVRVTARENRSIEDVTNTDIDAYRLLLQSEELLEPPPPRPTQDSPLSRWLGVAAAFAAEPQTIDTGTAEIQSLLEEYRQALEAGNLDRLETLYAEPSSRRRELQRQYLDNVRDLKVELSDVRIEVQSETATMSFTRRDHFVDRASGKEQRLEVRLSRRLVRRGDHWKMAGKP